MNEDDRHYNTAIKEALVIFIGLVNKPTFSNSVRSQIAEIRRYIMPADDMSMMSVHDVGQFGNYSAQYDEDIRNTLNPAPYESLKKSAAGFLSFHHTPYEKFFKTKLIPASAIQDIGLQQEIQRYWAYRDVRTHAIMWHAENIMQEVIFIMSRLAFNLGVKTLDIDANLTVKKTTHPIENLILFSSDGVHQDIVGIYEDLNWFQYKRRFKSTIMDISDSMKQARDKAYDFTFGSVLPTLARPKDIRVYRINMGVGVFKDWMDAVLIDKDEKIRKMWEEKVSSQYKLKENQIVDLILDEFGHIISITSRDYRTVIVGHLGYVTKDGIRGKGQGDMALTTAKVLQETEEILMDGYEKAYGPSYIMPSALEEHIYGMMSRNDILFSDEPEGVKPLVVPLDLNTAKALAVAWEDRIKSLFFLDIFSLIEKNRMPVNEISLRRADGFKQLGLYVSADTAYNLEPEALSIMKMDEEVNDVPSPPILEGKLRVHYISPIIQAIKSTSLDEYGRTIAVLRGLKELEEGPASRVVDLDHFAMNILNKTDNLELALPQEVKAAKAQVAQEMQRLQLDKAVGDAHHARTQGINESIRGLNESSAGSTGAEAGAAQNTAGT